MAQFGNSVPQIMVIACVGTGQGAVSEGFQLNLNLLIINPQDGWYLFGNYPFQSSNGGPNFRPQNGLQQT